jgi:Arc/MetJ-type ribon-helix-helix transcriptional regulator
MRETLTISLPKRLRRDLEKMARAEGVTSSEYVRRAIKADLFRRALRGARRELVPQARARGIYTDEDVFGRMLRSNSLNRYIGNLLFGDTVTISLPATAACPKLSYNERHVDSQSAARDAAGGGASSQAAKAHHERVRARRGATEIVAGCI